MLKIVICLAQHDSEPSKTWHTSLRSLLKQQSANLTRAEVLCSDEHVQPAHLLEMKFTSHPKDAVVIAWADSINDFGTLIEKLQRSFTKLQAYLVVESNVIPMKTEEGRIEGMCQIAFLKRPAKQFAADWMNIWLGSHTKIAVDTQSTFGYRQNIVLSPWPLNESKEETQWPIMDAIVEENFPTAAMHSREVFFNAEGDPEKFERHQQTMMESSFRFIDFDNFDCIPMSQYIIK